MLNVIELRELIHQEKLSRQDCILLLLGANDEFPKSVSQLCTIAKEAGITAIDKWNISAILSRAKGLAIRVPEGWVLSNSGKVRVAEIAGIKQSMAVRRVANDLHKLIASLSDRDTRSFLEEALSCFETNNFRAAVVLSWVGAISILQKHVVNNVLAEFNAEAIRRDNKWRPAKTPDDLSRMKESGFLDILAAISVIGKDVKQELEQCLKLRNSCGHPNSLRVGENRVASHLEILIFNVYSKY